MLKDRDNDKNLQSITANHIFLIKKKMSNILKIWQNYYSKKDLPLYTFILHIFNIFSRILIVVLVFSFS